MAPRESRSAAQTTISSPPNTTFNLQSLLDEHSTTTPHDPTANSPSPSKYLLWLDTTPVLLEIPNTAHVTDTQTITATTITEHTTPSDLDDLLWGHLADCMYITDDAQINSEAKETATILPDAYTKIAKALDGVTEANSLVETIKMDINAFDGFHMAIAELTDNIETTQQHLVNCQSVLTEFNEKLIQKDIKDSGYNRSTKEIIANCTQTKSTISELLAELPSITPQTQSHAFTSIRTQLKTIRSQLHHIAERIKSLYESATGTEIQDTLKTD